jgi:DinB superfamily
VQVETDRIADLIERVAEGDPWHGPSVASLLRDISAASAAQPGPGGAHGIWALVLHMTGWAREVTARLGGRAAQDPEAGDWPSIGEPTPARWAEAQAALFEVHRQLARAVREFDVSRLATPVSDFRDNALGTGLSHYLTLHGLVHHTVYHAGQIAVVKRSLG